MFKTLGANSGGFDTLSLEFDIRLCQIPTIAPYIPEWEALIGLSTGGRITGT